MDNFDSQRNGTESGGWLDGVPHDLPPPPALIRTPSTHPGKQEKVKKTIKPSKVPRQKKQNFNSEKPISNLIDLCSSSDEDDSSDNESDSSSLDEFIDQEEDLPGIMFESMDKRLRRIEHTIKLHFDAIKHAQLLAQQAIEKHSSKPPFEFKPRPKSPLTVPKTIKEYSSLGKRAKGAFDTVRSKFLKKNN
jgi:hypothetical protein